MEHDEFQIRVIDSLARLETNMKDLVGNGQPGRIQILEEQVKDLNRVKWLWGGIITGVATTISAIVHFVFKY